MSQPLLILTFALGLILGPASGLHATQYELMGEWPGVTFHNGAKEVTLFLHMSDLNAPLSDAPADDDRYVPLYELTPKDILRRGGKQEGDVESLNLTSRKSGYEMSVALDKEHKLHAVRKGEFKTMAAHDLTTITAVFGIPVTANKPWSVLVMVAPEGAAPAPAHKLNDVELAALNSMEPMERVLATQECNGTAEEDVAHLDCWREKIKQVMQKHKDAAPQAASFTPFEQRYIQQRLSEKSYRQFQSELSQPKDTAQQAELVQNWHARVLEKDIKENASLLVKTEAKPAAVAAPVEVKASSTAAAAPIEKAESSTSAPAVELPPLPRPIEVSVERPPLDLRAVGAGGIGALLLLGWFLRKKLQSR